MKSNLNMGTIIKDVKFAELNIDIATVLLKL